MDKKQTKMTKIMKKSTKMDYKSLTDNQNNQRYLTAPPSGQFRAS